MLKWKRLLFYVPLAFLVCAVAFILTCPNAPQAAPPRQSKQNPPYVVETSPAEGYEVPLHGLVTFTFDRSMDTQNGFEFSIIPVLEGAKWGWFSHTELRDEKLVLYANYLPSRTYTYVYRLRLGLPGQFNAIPTIGQAFYFPEVYGRSNGVLFTIEP